MSRQRNLRKKPTLSFDDDEGEGEDTPAILPPAAKAAKDKKAAAQKLKLSFGDDGEEAAAAGKAAGRPKSSLRAPGTVPPPPAAADERAQRVYTQMSGAGEYSAERLRELAANTRSLPSAKPAGGCGGALGGFKLSGSFKPAAPPKDDRFQYNVNAAGVVRPPPPEQPLARPGSRDAALPPPAEPPPPLPAGGAPPAGGAQQVGAAAVAADEDEEPDIPDEEMIAWAKAKRERLRGAHLAPDYIPTAAAPPGLSRLRDKKKAEEAVAAGSGSESEEGEDEMRMQFMGAGPAAAAGARAGSRGGSRAGGRAGGRAAAAAEEEGEDEDELFAQEQIRKGMGGLLAAGGRPGSSAALAADGEAVAGAAARPAAAAFAAAGASQAAAIQAQADEVMRALQAGLQRLQTSRQQAERNLERTQRSLQSSLAGISRMEGDLEAASAKYVYVQKLRAYVADLCHMLQDKSPIVEELEDALMDLCEGRAAAAARRRADGDSEEAPPAEAAVAAATAVLSRGGDAAAAAAAAKGAADAAEEQMLGKDLPVELDEFGRDMNAERKAELAQRAKQRQQRLAALERRYDEAAAAGGSGSGPAEPHLGDDTSEESEGEAAHFATRQGEVQEAADAVFRDASDEYGSLPAVKRQLEEWKVQQPGAYRDAYVSLSAPALFAPFVRLELLKWRPLHGGEAGFDGHQWYQQLFDYGMPQDPAALDPSDPDANLVPQLVLKLVLPLARQLLRGVWSPYSRQQSRAAAAMLADLLVYVPPEEEALQEVVREVQAKLEAAVDALALPAWPPAAVAASRRAAVHLAQRFGRGLRLLASVCAFDGSLPRAALQRLALERLVTAQLLPYARSAAGNPALAADRASRIVAALPADWFRSGVPPKGGEGLADLLSTLARSLEAQAGGGGTTAAAAAARQVAAALHHIGDAARANKLAKAFGVL